MSLFVRAVTLATTTNRCACTARRAKQLIDAARQRAEGKKP